MNLEFSNLWCASQIKLVVINLKIKTNILKLLCIISTYFNFISLEINLQRIQKFNLLYYTLFDDIFVSYFFVASMLIKNVYLSCLFGKTNYESFVILTQNLKVIKTLFIKHNILVRY